MPSNVQLSKALDSAQARIDELEKRIDKMSEVTGSAELIEGFPSLSKAEVKAVREILRLDVAAKQKSHAGTHVSVLEKRTGVRSGDRVFVKAVNNHVTIPNTSIKIQELPIKVEVTNWVLVQLDAKVIKKVEP